MSKKKKNSFKYMLWSIYAFMLTSPTLAFANDYAKDDLTTIASKFKNLSGVAVDTLMAISFAAGCFMIFMAVLGFKKHSDDPQRHPIMKPVVLALIGAAATILPTMIFLSSNSITEGDTKGASTGESNFGSLNDFK